jgi:hypothetical protein
MRLALLWALGLLGAGSPRPSPPLPNIGEFPGQWVEGMIWKEVQGNPEAMGCWGLPEPNQRAACVICGPKPRAR